MFNGNYSSNPYLPGSMFIYQRVTWVIWCYSIYIVNMSHMTSSLDLYGTLEIPWSTARFGEIISWFTDLFRSLGLLAQKSLDCLDSVFVVALMWREGLRSKAHHETLQFIHVEISTLKACMMLWYVMLCYLRILKSFEINDVYVCPTCVLDIGTNWQTY